MNTLSTKRRYTKVTIKDVVNLYNRGLNFSQIARKLNCCRNTIRKKIHQYVSHTGINIYITCKPFKCSLSFDDIYKLYKNKMPVKQIASTAGVSTSYIYKIIKGRKDASWK